jgi:hypothetical protein
MLYKKGQGDSADPSLWKLVGAEVCSLFGVLDVGHNARPRGQRQERARATCRVPPQMHARLEALEPRLALVERIPSIAAMLAKLAIEPVTGRGSGSIRSGYVPSLHCAPALTPPRKSAQR